MGAGQMKKTIEVLKKERCVGCKACADICPVNAIAFYDEKDGFWYPQIDSEKCIMCGMCQKICPGLNDVSNPNENVKGCFGVKSKNENTRFNSTSGGFFSEIATKWIEDGGVVIGAAYNDSHRVYHFCSKNLNDIEKLRQSKYLQSDTAGIYKETKKLLDTGKKVLFCGIPCQIEALLLFLGEKNSNLLTLDFVCCGICSPGIYLMYLKELEKKYKSKVKKVWFKNKEAGWRSIGTRIDFDNGKHYFRVGYRDLFMTSFVTDALSMRLSCEECKYRKLPHNSDIMIGDFWGIENINKSFDDNKGVSAVLINTKNGMELFESVKDKLYYFETTANDISRGNFTIYEPKHVNPHREEFIELMNKRGFRSAMGKYSEYSGINKIELDLLYFRSNIKKFLKKEKNTIWEE